MSPGTTSFGRLKSVDNCKVKTVRAGLRHCANNLAWMGSEIQPPKEYLILEHKHYMKFVNGKGIYKTKVKFFFFSGIFSYLLVLKKYSLVFVDWFDLRQLFWEILYPQKD